MENCCAICRSIECIRVYDESEIALFAFIYFFIIPCMLFMLSWVVRTERNTYKLNYMAAAKQRCRQRKHLMLNCQWKIVSFEMSKKSLFFSLFVYEPDRSVVTSFNFCFAWALESTVECVHVSRTDIAPFGRTSCKRAQLKSDPIDLRQ